MKRFLFLLIGIMMAGGMAAAEATGNDNTTKATIPVGSSVMVPVSEEPKEVVFDVEGVEIIAQTELEAVEGARPIREDPGETYAYSQDKTDYKYGRDYSGLVGETIDNVIIRDENGHGHLTLVVIDSARQTSKTEVDITYHVYLRFPGQDHSF
jgi:hypothetical protein